MLRKLVIGALGAMAVLFSTTAFAQGTAADAKAMLEKAVAAIKADKARALEQINAGTNGFLVGDIYPFCFNLSDGLNIAGVIQMTRHRVAKTLGHLRTLQATISALGSMRRQKRDRSMKSATNLQNLDPIRRQSTR
jgi:hypothetical protein